MTVREATEADIGVIHELIAELADYEQLGNQVVCTEDDLRQALFGPDRVAEVSLAVDDADGEVAGHALWYRTFSTFLGRPGIWLEDLFVREPYRRRGHARALLNHLRSRTDGRIEWEVIDWNRPAMAFYESMGAQEFTGWTKYRWV